MRVQFVFTAVTLPVEIENISHAPRAGERPLEVIQIMSMFKWHVTLFGTSEDTGTAWEALADISGEIEIFHEVPVGQILTLHQLHLISGEIEALQRRHAVSLTERERWLELAGRVSIETHHEQRFVTSLRPPHDESIFECIRTALSKIAAEQMT